MIYTCHITFINYETEKVPFHISFTSVHPEYKTINIGLFTYGLKFNYTDIKEFYNQNMCSFYKYKSKEFDYLLELDQFENELNSIIDYDLILNEKDFEIKAIDVDTFHFLCKALPHLKLTLIESKIEDRTLATAYRYVLNKTGFMNYTHTIQISFIQFNGNKIPWHISITSTTRKFNTILIGLSETGLLFTDEEWVYNEKNVHDFPRVNDYIFNYQWPYNEFNDNLKKFLNEEAEKYMNMIVFDESTYHYLLNIMDSRQLTFKQSTSFSKDKQIMLISEDKSLAAAYRLFNNII